MTIYYNSLLHAEQIHLPGRLSPIEDIGIKFDSVTVISVYVPPATSFRAVSKHFSHLLLYAKDSGGFFVILGDFNISLGQCEELELEVANSGFVQLIHKPTHELGSVLDLAFTNYPADDCKATNIPVYYTDHHLISVQLIQ